MTCLQAEAGQQGTRSVAHHSVHSQLMSSVVLSDCQVEAEKGAESVQLPFRTAPELLNGTKVIWWRYEPGQVLRVFEYLPEEPQQLFRNRSKMNEDFLSTGDLSLTLNHVTDELFGSYRCGVYKRGKLLMWTTVHLKDKGLLSSVVFVHLAECLPDCPVSSAGKVRVQSQTEDIRDRRGSIDLTPLMAQVDNG